MHKVAYGILFSYLLFEMRKVGQCRSRLGDVTDGYELLSLFCR